MTRYKNFLHSILLIIVLMVLFFNFGRSSNHFNFHLGVQPRTEYTYTVIKVDSEHLEDLFGDVWSSAFIPSGATEEGKRSKIVVTDSQFYQENLTAIVKYDYWDFINEEEEFSLIEDKTVLERCHAPEFYTEEIFHPFVFTLAPPYYFLPQLRYFENEEGCWRGVYVNSIPMGRITDGQIIYEKHSNIQMVCFIDGEPVLMEGFYKNYTLNWIYHDDTGWLKSFFIMQYYDHRLPEEPLDGCGHYYGRIIYEISISSNSYDVPPNNILFGIEALVCYGIITGLTIGVVYKVIKKKSYNL